MWCKTKKWFSVAAIVLSWTAVVIAEVNLQHKSTSSLQLTRRAGIPLEVTHFARNLEDLKRLPETLPAGKFSKQEFVGTMHHEGVPVLRIGDVRVHKMLQALKGYGRFYYYKAVPGNEVISPIMQIEMVSEGKYKFSDVSQNIKLRQKVLDGEDLLGNWGGKAHALVYGFSYDKATVSLWSRRKKNAAISPTIGGHQLMDILVLRNLLNQARVMKFVHPDSLSPLAIIVKPNGEVTYRHLIGELARNVEFPDKSLLQERIFHQSRPENLPA